jgi:hypothetical protein
MGLPRSSAVGVCSGALVLSLVHHVVNQSAKIHPAKRPVTNAAISHEYTALNAFRSAGLAGFGTASPAIAPATSFVRQRLCRSRLRRCPEKSRREPHQPIQNTPRQPLEGALPESHHTKGSNEASSVINFNERKQNETLIVGSIGFDRL